MVYKKFRGYYIFSGDASRLISDLKFKLVKSEQDVTALEQNVSVFLDTYFSFPI